MATHYDNLQVSPKASDAVIRASYRVLVQKYHPDRFEPREEAERITRILNAAWKVLGDPASRAVYDRDLAIQASLQSDDSSITPPPKRRQRKSRLSPYSTPEIDRLVNYIIDGQDDINEKIVEQLKVLMLKRRIDLGPPLIFDDSEETRFLQSIKDRMGMEQGMTFMEICAFIDVNMGNYSQPSAGHPPNRRTDAPAHPPAPRSGPSSPATGMPRARGSDVRVLIIFAVAVFLVLWGLARQF
jgi:hypothetical protein